MKRLTLLAPLVSILGFVGVSLGVGSKSGLSGLDETVWRFFAEHRDQSLSEVARWLTSLGAMGTLLPVSVVVSVCLWVWTRSVVRAVAPWLSLQVSSVLVRLSKVHYGVTRPPIGSQIVKTTSPAFPSGHVGNTAALAVCVAVVMASVSATRRSQISWACTAGAVVVVMAWTRLQLNVHWLSDVIGGACLGAAVGFAVGGLGVTLGTRRSVRSGAIPGGTEIGSDFDA